MKFATHKPIDTYWTYNIEGTVLTHEFSWDQFQTGERNPTAAIVQRTSVNHPQERKAAVTRDQPTIQKQRLRTVANRDFSGR